MRISHCSLIFKLGDDGPTRQERRPHHGLRDPAVGTDPTLSRWECMTLQLSLISAGKTRDRFLVPKQFFNHLR